ncbi:MAG TPA: S1 RNA-binding domain-containing protein [Polyangiales bacterium]
MSDISERTESEATSQSSQPAAAEGTAPSPAAAQAVAEVSHDAVHDGAPEAPASSNESSHSADTTADEHDDDTAGGSDGEEGDASGDASSDASSDAGSEAGANATPGKRKRRRRKKRKDGSSADDVSAAGEGSEAGHQAQSKKKESHAPFAHLFGGAHGAKRHAFAVGEVVAGRVQRVEHGVIVVDLFGKATAIVDEYEPRDVPLLPEVSAAKAEAAAAAAAAEGREPAKLDAAPEAAQAETAAVGGATDAAHEAAPVAVEAAEPVAQTPEAEATTHVGETTAVDLAAHGDDLDDSDDDSEPGHPPEPQRERPEPPKLGQVWKGRVGAVSESGHIALINRIIEAPAVRQVLEQRRAEHKRVEGVVYGFNRGGFDVLVEGLRAFCPASAMSLDEIRDPLEYVGKKLEFLLPASKAGSKDIIVSRRSILERLLRRQTKEFLRTITPGQRFKGRVTAVREFGVFVDIGGVEGLVHQSELSYAFGVKPNSVAQVGDELEVQVLKVGGEPRREKDSGKRDRLTRVSLSVKACLPDPWQSHADALAEGSVHKGKVVRATEFGAFIALVDSIEGLLHITELGRDLKHADQAVREGDEIYVAIERVDRRARRISLSKLSAAEVKEFEAGNLAVDDGAARNLRQGQNVKLKVERIEPRCVFAHVAGTVGRRGRAFIPNSETGTDRGTDLRKKFPPGSELEAKIIGIDRDGSLKCSIKAMEIDEERKAVKDYRREAAKQGFGTFGDLLRAKLGEASQK